MEMKTNILEGTLEGFPSYDKALIQKAYPLLSLNKQTGFSLTELKILDIYLARINSHDPSRRTVRLKKREIETILGVDRIRREELEKKINKLFSPVTLDIDVPEGYKEAFRKMTLFEVADLYRTKDGYWEVELCCTEKAMSVIFNIENIGYFKYRLTHILSLTSKYSYDLYLNLLHCKQEKFVIDFETLKNMMNCHSVLYLSEKPQGFKQFNFCILKPSVQEINEKTDITVGYKVLSAKAKKCLNIDKNENVYAFWLERKNRKKAIE